MARSLKVFRTAIGFHDAYVAAPSRKAALQAWGADVDLFARGVAEQVTDPALIAEPLAHPGAIIRKLRGTKDENLAALPEAPARARRSSAHAGGRSYTRARNSGGTPSPPPRPRPDRDALDAAQQAIDDADRRYQDARRAIAEQEVALANRRRALEAEHDDARRELEARRDDEEARYRRALAAWRKDSD
jgi:hypothetical protein